MTEQPKTTVPKGRSPGYPGVTLETALERVEKLYEVGRGHWLPLSEITKAWGYASPTTGPASVTYAALKKFGLLEEQGSGKERKAKLSALALEIVMNPDPAPYIKEAALKPQAHRDLWEAHGANLPPDTALRYELVMQRRFTEGGAVDFIRKYRRTIAFAQLGDSDTVTRSEPEKPEAKNGADSPPAGNGTDEGNGDNKPKPQRKAEPGVLSIPVPVIGGEPILIEGRFPVSEAAWTQFLAVLQAMKPGLVAEPAPETQPDPQS